MIMEATADTTTASHSRVRGLDELPEHVRQIALMRGLGYSYAQIGKQVRMSPRSVAITLSQHRRSLKSLRVAMENSAQLSARAANILGRHGIRTREEARSANLLEILGRERNCGRKTIDEIKRWMDQVSGVNLVEQAAMVGQAA